jgi:predicted permease
LGGIAVVGAASSSKVLGAAVGAVTSLVVTTAIGAQTVRSGLISPASISALARIVYGVFLPAFLGTSVIHTVTNYGVQPELLVMPLAAAAQIFLARAVARRCLLPFIGVNAETEAGRELLFCCTFHNPGVLPLLFFDAFFRAPYSDPLVLPKLIAYVSFYLMGYSPICWSVGRGILLDDRSSTTQKSTDDLHLAARLRRAVLGFVSPPPVAGAVAGLLIATCPPLRELFVGSDAPLGVAFKAVERFAGGYLPSASLCLAGSLVSGAGASVASVLASADHSNDDNDELASSKSIAEPLDIGFKQRIAVICAARFVVMPLIGAGALQLLAAANLLPSPAAQPVLWFFLLTQFSMPPAQNSVVMLQVAGKPEGATRMARTLFLVYAFSTVPLALLFHAHIKACELF